MLHRNLVLIKSPVNEIDKFLRASTKEFQGNALIPPQYGHRAVIALGISSGYIHKRIHVLVSIPGILPELMNHILEVSEQMSDYIEEISDNLVIDRTCVSAFENSPLRRSSIMEVSDVLAFGCRYEFQVVRAFSRECGE